MKKQILLFFFLGLSIVFRAQNWDSLKSGFNLPPDVLYADSADNYLYAAGVFTSVDNKPIHGIARWNGIQWDSLKTGIDGLTPGSLRNTWAITRYNGKLVVGGTFYSLGNIAARCIGTWDGSNWDSIPVQPLKYHSYPAVRAMAVINNELYIGGRFDTINDSPCQGIAKWDGSSWTRLNMPPMYDVIYVNAIIEYHNEIYVGGNFQTAGYPNDTVQDLIRYDGTNWRSVGGGMKGAISGVESMAIYNDELYVAGLFKFSDGNFDNYIQRWNGTSWNSAGGGTGGPNGQIHHLQVFKNKLYAMGVFHSAGGVPAQFIAYWDGAKWCGLGSSFDNALLSGCVYNDSLYIGGGFWTIDGVTMNRIARWNGGSYVDTCGSIPIGIKETEINHDLNIYPNPSTGQITIELISASTESSIDIKNILGETVKIISTGALIKGSNKIEMDVSELTSGIYFVQVRNKSKVYSAKFIKQ